MSTSLVKTVSLNQILVFKKPALISTNNEMSNILRKSEQGEMGYRGDIRTFSPFSSIFQYRSVILQISSMN